MAITKGDKIGFTAPTDLGDADVWGGLLHTIYEQLDELCYSAREDRNLSFLGGGKISWDGTSVTFTEDIIIRDHITNKIVTITTAASPIAMATANDVAYIAKNRKPAANQSIASVTVVAAGALPNDLTDGNMGLIVLFHRTSDATILIPWARREILSSDHWRFGAALSWYERIASARKPGYRSNIADTSQVIVPAATTTPAVVMIEGEMFANTSNATMDLDTAGRNGLDTGAKAANTAYYLYAITPVSGRGFDVVTSVTNPATGPTGFSNWSYIGAFCTVEAASTIANFQASNGEIVFEDEVEDNTHTGNTSFSAETFNALPSTVKKAWMYISVTGAATDVVRAAGTNVSVSTNAIIVRQIVANSSNFGFGWVPIFTANTIYLLTDDAGNTVTGNLMGWQEDPMEYP